MAAVCACVCQLTEERKKKKKKKKKKKNLIAANRGCGLETRPGLRAVACEGFGADVPLVLLLLFAFLFVFIFLSSLHMTFFLN
jgi:hypothetical protein